MSLLENTYNSPNVIDESLSVMLGRFAVPTIYIPSSVKDSNDVIPPPTFFLVCSPSTIIQPLQRYIYMRYIIMLFIGFVAFGLLKREKVKWYEYIGAFVLWFLACLGLMVV